MKLNRKLCNSAQKWANHLVAEKAYKHSQNEDRRCSKGPTGENLHYSRNKREIKLDGSVPVDSWYNEIKDYDFAQYPSTSRLNTSNLLSVFCLIFILYISQYILLVITIFRNNDCFHRTISIYVNVVVRTCVVTCCRFLHHLKYPIDFLSRLSLINFILLLIKYARVRVMTNLCVYLLNI